MKKQWYDYLWILSLTYLILGFFNIMFAWLGLICFFVPLLISLIKGTKGYAQRDIVTATAEEASCLDCWAAPSGFPAKQIFQSG